MSPLRRFQGLLWAVLVVAGLLVFAATGPAPGAAGGPQAGRRVALFVNGTLGDKSFYDSAARGLSMVKSPLHLQARMIEGGEDPTRWEAAFIDVVESGDFDLIVTGTFAMVPLVQRMAARFPRMRFILFDAQVDRAQCACANVHAIRFRQNEGAYMAGYLAVRLASALFPAAGPPAVGVVGGMQIPVVEDYVVGFKAGARAADPASRVAVQYVNSFSDPATAKEIAKALYSQGAKVLLSVASGAGQGVVEAAAETQRYVIGVDADQYALATVAQPARARWVVSSVMKNVDVAVARALRQHFDGTLPGGQVASLGLAEQGIALAPVSAVLAAAPRALIDELAVQTARVADHRVPVPSVFAAVQP